MISEENPYFSYYACKILGPQDFDFKTSKGKHSKSLKMVVTTISELSLRSPLKLLQATSVARIILQDEKNMSFHLIPKTPISMDKSKNDRVKNANPDYKTVLCVI